MNCSRKSNNGKGGAIKIEINTYTHRERERERKREREKKREKEREREREREKKLDQSFSFDAIKFNQGVNLVISINLIPCTNCLLFVVIFLLNSQGTYHCCQVVLNTNRLSTHLLPKLLCNQCSTQLLTSQLIVGCRLFHIVWHRWQHQTTVSLLRASSIIRPRGLWANTIHPPRERRRLHLARLMYKRPHPNL